MPHCDVEGPVEHNGVSKLLSVCQGMASKKMALLCIHAQLLQYVYVRVYVYAILIYAVLRFGTIVIREM